MPKSRGSGSIASSGGTGAAGGGASPGGAGSPEELADRVIDRLSEITSVTVPSFSASRGTQENLSVTFNPNTPGIAMVDSSSGVTYLVDYNEDTCTCPDHRFRGRRCRHIAAAHEALGEINGGSTSPEVSPGQAAAAADIQEAVTNQREIDIRGEESRRNIQQVEEDDGFFYTENDVEFETTLQRSRRAALPYDYENALNGSNITFGLEIEFVGGNPNAIARELYDLGICAHDRRVGYHSASVPGKWKLEKDGSVSSGDEGGELVSPILKDTPETWRTLEKICEVAQRHGARVNQKCGGHVHMSMDPLDTARQRWRRFFRSVAGFEDVTYRLAGGSLGQIRSGAIGNYAAPFQDRAQRNATARYRVDDINDVHNLARNASGSDRYLGINLTNIYQNGRPNTVEFRYFNSSLDPKQLQANVKIANGFMMAAEKARTQDSTGSSIFPSDSMKKRGQMLKEHSMGRNSRTDHSGIKKFVDIMFTRKKDKDAIIGVYAKNNWAD